MKCRKCNREMETDDWNVSFINDGEELWLRELFWCPACDIFEIKRTYYKKVSEEYE